MQSMRVSPSPGISVVALRPDVRIPCCMQSWLSRFPCPIH